MMVNGGAGWEIYPLVPSLNCAKKTRAQGFVSNQ